jgi:uncharacterized protein YndB with AHSA1/START domain
MNQSSKKPSAERDRAEVELSREYDFPRELVFRMFTDRDKAIKLYSPEGAVKLDFELDPRPGGAFRVHDRFDGTEGRTSGTITEIVVPELLVFRTATSINGATPPFEVLQSVKFEALGPKRTRVTIRVKILEVGAFVGGAEALAEGFLGGWGQTLDIVQRELR